VRYTGTTSCTKVIIDSKPPKHKPRKSKALSRKRMGVRGDSFTFVRKVRSKAALGSHTVLVTCAKGRHRLIGSTSLRVVSQLPVNGNRPVLPQLLLGLGLLEVGGILIAVGRRPQFPKTRHRTGRGPSGALRKSVHVYAD
jgi:hypothetical protein